MPPLKSLARQLVFAAVMVFAVPGSASEITIVGTAHLEQLLPAPGADQIAPVVDALLRWRPSLVCIEAMPGERVEEFVRDPARHGPLLSVFGAQAVRLAPEQQLRLAQNASAARDAARTLAMREGELSVDERLALASLHLAAYEPWSAALIWSALAPEHRAAGEKALGRNAVDALDRLVASGNDIARIALPVARRMGHRQLCHADPFLDEAAVGTLVDALTPMLTDAGVGKGIARFNALSASRWNAAAPEGLLQLLGWMQSADYAQQDREAQWDIFAGDPAVHDAGERRLALWNARNAEISALLFRALARPDGARVMLVIGAAHRPFLERAITAQPWVVLKPSSTLLPAR